ncbi:hypothetical protein PPERSA_03883 [Pseudocohnilembus persalinus]|uniref:Uncharacterized protein n=1 Tax=Pseudocohnilembus persalinus TaxID=266149 RepID=A0A0V0Q932_PSEPJ|nr:hypothetical protein PPERSA_03883 [Pseudocohnilembus persalinus]|eukprot:KRW98748.1 hypothetical protein PPERSA_03883 [Pseudocohnilembus persalinus]
MAQKEEDIHNELFYKHNIYQPTTNGYNNYLLDKNLIKKEKNMLISKHRSKTSQGMTNFEKIPPIGYYEPYNAQQQNGTLNKNPVRGYISSIQYNILPTKPHQTTNIKNFQIFLTPKPQKSSPKATSRQ